MNKKLIISGAAVLIIAGGIFTKNSIVKSQFEEEVQKEVSMNPSINSIDGDYFCSGIFTTKCGIDDVKILMQDRRLNNIKLTANTIEIDNVTAANKFQSIQSPEPTEVLKGLMKINDNYTFTIEGLKLSVNQDDEKFIKELKAKAQKEFSKTDYTFFEKLVDLYAEDGIDMNSYVSVNNEGLLSLKSNLKGIGLSLDFETNIDFEKDDIENANRYTLMRSLLSTKIDDFSLNAEAVEYSVPELAAFALKLPIQNSRYKQRRFERNLQKLGINSNFSDFSGKDIEKFFNSDNAKNISDKITTQIENNLSMFIRDKKTTEYIHKLLNDISEKITALGKDDDDSVKIRLSTNNKSIQELSNEIQTQGKLDLEDSLNISIN
ncbi:hypothetical protein CRU98_05735 [Arcobacter sp. CECT 8986]|uniref:hypothetical protein n=1 Tax=Arcobacter sp. CECT 8986 TaxID=2044507 RepID=UPI001009E704|nr:hypothetical protein [Arcobacter sp. CECT 8986]RXJ99528.1 hypothetical protein CRU98_05735 [Arcobacter sp. CECT 8986]